MSQNKMNKNFLILGFISLITVAFSCSPKASGVRAAVKTGQQNLSPAVSAQSEQQALNQGLLYKIRSVSTPNPINGGHEVSVEIETPSKQFLPLKTQHSDGQLETNGTYDEARGIQLNVQARCTAEGCAKYAILLTVLENGQRKFQTGAISFASDCKFSVISIGSNVATLFSNLNAFEYHYNSVQPVNDQGSCQ